MNKKIEYNGTVYPSVKAFAEDLEMSYQTTAALLRKGYTPESVATMLSEKLKRERSASRQQAFRQAEEQRDAKGGKAASNAGKAAEMKKEEAQKVQAAKDRPQTAAAQTRQHQVRYRGRSYPSLHAFCVQNKLDEKEVERLVRLGAPLEEIASLDVDDTRKENGVYQIARMSPGLRNTFTLNPYCVLGISAGSGRKEALDVRDKLEKLSRIGAESAYKSPFDMDGVERPYRKLGNIQAMLRGLDNEAFRYLWFLESGPAKTWQSADPVVTSMTMMGDPGLFDQILSEYYAVLITDPDIFDQKKWKSLLEKLFIFFDTEDRIQVQALGERVLPGGGKSDVEISRNVHKALAGPILDILDNADGKQLLRFYKLTSSVSENFGFFDLEEMKEHADKAAAEWSKQRFQELGNLVDELLKEYEAWEADEEDVREVQMTAERVTGLYFNTAEELSHYMDPVAGENMMRLVKVAVRSAAAYLFNTGEHSREAARYFSMVYAYCTRSEKQEIHRVCEESMLSIPDSAYAVYELVDKAISAENSGKMQEAYRWYRKAALRGDERSQLKIALMLSSGKVKAQKGEDAFTWYERAALNGNEEMCIAVSETYENGVYCRKKDPAKAMEFAIRAFLANPSQRNIERLDKKYPSWRKGSNPLFRFRDGQVEEERLIKYAETGIPSAVFCYGKSLITKSDEVKKLMRGKKEDYQYDRKKKAAFEEGEAAERTGRRLILRAAADGESQAIDFMRERYELDIQPTDGAEMIERAEICEENSDEGIQDDLQFYWYRLAVKAKEKQAYYGLASCYDNGIGTEEDAEKAFSYYQKALENGDERARLSLAGSLMIGRGTARDLTKAKEYLTEASQSQNMAIAEMARSLLDERFGSRSGGNLYYDDFSEFSLCEKKGIEVSFLGIESEENKFRMKLQVKNSGQQKQSVWIRNLALDGKTILTAQMLGQFAAARTGACEVIVSRSLPGKKFTLELSLEVRRSKKDVTQLGRVGFSVDVGQLPPDVKLL